MTTLQKLAITAISLLLQCSFVGGQAGSLDATFGEEGIFKLPYQSGIARYTEDVLSWQQSDGKVVVVGLSSSDYSLQVSQMRLTAGGLPDPDFENGAVALPLTHLYAALHRPDGTYGLFYLWYAPDGSERYMFQWFEANGTFLPNSAIELPSGFLLHEESVIWGPNGTILVCGYRITTGELAIARFFADGTLDISWGASGYVILPSGLNWIAKTNLSMDDSGRVVLSGESYQHDTIAVMRLLSENGAMDMSFSDDGLALLPGGWEPSQSFGKLLAQPDGKIIFSKLDMAAVAPRLSHIRLNESGDPDVDFGQNGWVHTALPTTTSVTSFYQKAILSALTATGALRCWLPLMSASNSETDLFGLAYEHNGNLDVDFGNAGAMTLNLDQYDLPEVLWIQQNGGIHLVASRSKLAATQGVIPEYSYLTAVSFDSNGALNLPYGMNGLAQVTFSKPSESYIAGFRQLSDGHMVMVGHFDDGNQKATEITRRMPDGYADVTFGSNGYARWEALTDGYNRQDACIWEDGSVALLSRNLSNNTSRLLKFNASGAPDETFAPGGQLILSGRMARIESAISGSFILCSHSGTMLTLKRYLSNGTLDMSFGTAGSVQIGTATSFDLSDIKVRNDGTIYLLGNEGNGANRATIVYRRTVSGQPDISFGVNGKLTENFSNYEQVEVMTLLPDGGLFLAGNIDYQSIGNSDSVFVARFHPDGTRDIMFGHLGVVVSSVFLRNIPVALLLQPDGKIVLAMSTAGADGIVAGTFLQTYFTDGSLDQAFGGASNGLLLPLVNEAQWGEMYWTPDNKIIVTGFDFPANFLQPTLARVIPDYLSDTETPSENQRNIAIFPNPCPARQSFVQLKVQLPQAGTAEIELMTSDGRVVERWPSRYFDEGEHTVQLPLLHSLSVGSYQCVWRTTEKTYSMPFTVF